MNIVHLLLVPRVSNYKTHCPLTNQKVCPSPLLKRTWILGQAFIFSSCGMVLVTTTASNGALLMREMAGPEKMPCVRMA